MTLVVIEVSAPLAAPIRHDWSRPEIRALFELSFPELMFRAQSLSSSG
jgi:biotin synthase